MSPAPDPQVQQADTGRSKAIRARVEIEPEDKADWRAVRTLQAISDQYVRSLPERTESAVTSGAIIPRKLKKK